MDLSNFTLCGYLTIKNLQPERPSETTTFFTGEIICEKNPFLTRKWDADESIDRKHWSKFLLHFKPFEKTFNDDNFDWDMLETCGAVFMRWKELFIISQPEAKSSAEPCSFAGFYYISLDKRLGDIEGYYFQKSSHDASYQSLMLEFKPDSEATAVFQLR